MKSRNNSRFGGLSVMVFCLAILQLTLGDVKICGDGLHKTLRLMCPSGFHSYKVKRTSLSTEDDYTNSNDEVENFGLSLDMFPFISSMESNSLAKIRRKRHAITHECCDKPCTLDELKSYCRYR